MKGKHAVEEPAVGGFGHFLATAPTTMATLWMKYSAAHVRKCLPWEVVNISKQTHRSITELVFGSLRVVFNTLYLILLSIQFCVFAYGEDSLITNQANFITGISIPSPAERRWQRVGVTL